MNTTATAFELVSPGKYAVEITLRGGRTRRILVKKEERLNPSARGGAYTTVWVAYNGGMYVREVRETRQAAFDAAMSALAARNMLPTD